MQEEKTYRLRQYRAGMKAGLPVVLGFIPVGIAYAIMAGQAGFTVSQTILMSLAVFAGASQMMSTGMYAQGAGLIVMIITTFIVNLRHLIMSTCVINRMKEGSLPQKLLAAFGVTDESFAIFTTEKEEHRSVYFFLWLISVTYTSWIAGSAIGALVNDFLPPVLSASFGIALYAMFIAILIPGLQGNLKLTILVVITAIVNTVISRFIPSSWALILSTLICAFAGVYFVDPGKEETADDQS